MHTYKPRTIILVLGLTAFAPILRVGFLWDDHVMIENNPQIQTWSLAAIRHDFTTDMFRGQGDPYFRPLQVLSNRIDYTLWGLHPIGHHVTQIAIHIGNGLLFYEVLAALGAPVLFGLVAGSLFVVHPIIVEEMMIIAGRGEILSLFFMLASLLLLLMKKPLNLAAGYVLFGCALLTKESAIVLPFLLALLYSLKFRPRGDYKHVGGLLLLTIPYLALRHHAVGALPLPPPMQAARFLFLAYPNVLVKYVLLLLLPWNLHSHRLMPHLSHAWPFYISLLTLGMAWIVHKQHRIAWVGIAWFIICLLPKIPVMMLGHFMLDHWIYPSSLAFFSLAAWIITEGWQSHTTWVKHSAGAVYGIAIILFSLLVHLNVALRGTDEKMYRWALHFTTSNPIKYNLAILLVQTGRPAEALPYLEDVHQDYPADLPASNALAMAYYYSGHPKIALIILERAHQQYPQDSLTNKNLTHLKTLLCRP